MKKNDEYKIPESCTDNDLVNLLLKIQKNNAENCYSNEDFFGNALKCYEETDNSDIWEFLKYRTTGFNHRIKINPFLILKIELNSTLIDLYKAFELTCVRAIYDCDLSEIKSRSIDFLKLIEHESVEYLNKETICLFDFKDELQAIDYYSGSDYETTVISCEKIVPSDIGLLRIYSKSLSYLEFRSTTRTLNSLIANTLADIYSKKINFKESVNMLNNICMLFRFNYNFFLISKIIHIETYPNSSEIQSVYDPLVCFSNIPTTFKINHHHGLEKCREIYKSQLPLSKHYIDFEEIERYNYEGENKYESRRNLKYFARKMLYESSYEYALKLYEENFSNFDCEIKKDYLITLLKTDRIIKAAKYFVELAENHREAINYFAVEKLHQSILENLTKLKDAEIPITLFIFKDIKSGSLNKNATAISLANYVKSKGVKYPSELVFSDEDKKTIFFLENVCNRDLLCKSMLFQYQKDAYDERIKICNLLTSRKLSNVDKLVFEAKELSKRKVLESASKYVSSSKVYADKDFVRTNTWDQFSSLHEELVSLSMVTEDIEKQLEIAMKKASEIDRSKLVEQSIIEYMTRHVSTYIKIGDNKKAKHLFNLMRCAVEEYCFGMKGLNSYLSTRIRHGTLFSTLLGPLINEGMVSDDKITPENEFISKTNGIEIILLEKLLQTQINFNENITKVVNNFVDKTIQIYANGKGEISSAFNYEIDGSSLIELQKQLGKLPSVNDTWNAIEDWISVKTNEGCYKVQQVLDNELRDALANSINAFEVKIDEIMNLSETYDSNELVSKVTKIRPELFNQLNVVRSWFDIDYALTEQEYTFDIVTDIAETMLRSKYVASEDCPQITVPHKILSPMVDLIYNLLSNAIKHSNVERKELKICIKSKDDGEYFSVDMTNSAQFDGCIEAENSRLEMYKNSISPEQLKSLLQKEGGTGIAKIKSILKHDLASNEFIDLKYVSKNEFVASIKLSKKSGVFSHENTNR